MNSTSEAVQALAALMEQRRKTLRLQWEEIAARAQISTTHLRRFRNGGAGISDIVEARLEEALQWAPGSIQRTLAGGNPTPLPGEGGSLMEAAAARAAGLPSVQDYSLGELEEAYRTLSTAQLLALLAESEAGMTQEERAKLDRVTEQEMEEWRRAQIRRRLIWGKLMRGDLADPKSLTDQSDMSS